MNCLNVIFGIFIANVFLFKDNLFSCYYLHFFQIKWNDIETNIKIIQGNSNLYLFSSHYMII